MFAVLLACVYILITAQIIFLLVPSILRKRYKQRSSIFYQDAIFSVDSCYFCKHCIGFRAIRRGLVLLPQDTPGYPRTHKDTQRYHYSIIFTMFINQIRFIFIECVIKSNITIQKNIKYVLSQYE